MGGPGQPPGHKGDHGPQDHGFVAGGQVFIVAGGAPVLADPGERALDDPAAGQDFKGMRVALRHDLECDLQRRGPGGQLAGVSGIRPDQADMAAGAVQVPQQWPGRFAVLDGRGGDHHIQNQPDGVHGNVPLAAVDLLGVVPATAGAGNSVGGADGLGVDDRRGGLGLAPGGGPDLGTQLLVEPGQGAVITPGSKIAVDGLPGREVRGQVPPGAPSPVQVQDCLDDPPDRPDPGTAPPSRHISWQEPGDHLPLGIGQVTGIAPGTSPGLARTLGTRGLCLPGRHKSGSWGPRLASARHDTPRSPQDNRRHAAILPRARLIRHSLSPAR
jgi:hypothetical protein